MKNKYFSNIEDGILRDIILKNHTYYGCLRELGLPTHGGNVQTLKRKIDQLNIDVSHFYVKTLGPKAAGQRSRKRTSKVEFDDLKKNINRLRRIIKERGRLCDNCKRSSWCGEEIPLEIHHIDGDNNNNKRSNISCLCPNCHALTDNWRGKKNKGISKK